MALAVYPISEGPAVYAAWRGWTTARTVEVIYTPVRAAANRCGPLDRLRTPWISWWVNRAQWERWREELMRQEAVSD